MNVDNDGVFGRPEAAAVEKIGRELIDSAFGRDGSLLTPGQPVWTTDHLAELQHDYVNQPNLGSGGLIEKLDAQLATTSSGAVQLFAELLIMNVLPISNLGGQLTLQQVQAVLIRCDPPVAIPDEVKQALLEGRAFHGGPAFGGNKPNQLAYLIAVSQHFKLLPEERRVDALTEPLVFRSEVDAIRSGQWAQRQALLYLAFPNFFLPIVNPEQRRLIRDTFAHDYLGRSGGDVDEDLHVIYEKMVDRHGEVDLYQSPWVDEWRKPAAKAPDPTDQVQHAWRVNGSNVAGQDMVPTWLKKSSTSLAAKFLRPVEPGVTEDELKGYVEQDYRSSGYAARQAKLDEFYSFLTRMHNNDLVVTVSQGLMRFGKITGDAEYVKSSDGRSNLRRPIHWLPTVVPIERVPDELVARLSAQDDVVDLTQQIDTLTELMERRDAGGHGRLHLPDADTQLAGKLNVPQQWLQQCIELLRDRPQMIFYGPPGTGKTYIAQELGRHLASHANVKLVQFHPAYSYEDFFEGYRPDAQSAGQIGYQLKPGPLRRIVDLANENRDAVYVLIIDEINRGNIAKIFGELYFLLEYRDETIDLMYSSGAFQLPKNVVIIGTMNTADRSIALVDSAMRRRFAFRALHPTESPTNGVLRQWLSKQGLPGDNADLLDALNNRIDDEEFKIGPSYFMRASVYKPGGLQLMWESSIIPLLEEFHFGDHDVDVRSMYGLDKLRKITQTEPPSAIEDDAPTTDSE